MSDISDQRRQARLREEQLLKRPPDVQELEELIRSGKVVQGGFFGPDNRSLYDIIEEDLGLLWRHGRTVEEVALRMQQLTRAGVAGLGTPVIFENTFEIVVEEHKGMNICPWPHRGGYRKRITTIRCLDSGKVLRWTDLGVHMILRHGFFQGRGSHYRLDPRQLVEVIFRAGEENA